MQQGNMCRVVAWWCFVTCWAQQLVVNVIISIQRNSIWFKCFWVFVTHEVLTLFLVFTIFLALLVEISLRDIGDIFINSLYEFSWFSLKFHSNLIIFNSIYIEYIDVAHRNKNYHLHILLSEMSLQRCYAASPRCLHITHATAQKETTRA